MGQLNEALFYDAVIMICAAMALVNVARTKSRGASAFYLAAAFLALGATVYAYSAQWPTAVVGVGGFIVFCLLVADLIFKVRKEHSK